MNDSPRQVQESVVLRYAARLGRSPGDLQDVSIQEGVRLVSQPIEYQGVTIDLLDMSSQAHTGTFKALLASLAVADVVASAERAFVTVSSCNTAMAMAAYAAPHGVECFLFVPALSGYKLDRRWFDARGVHLFVLDVAELELKRVAAQFSESSGLPLLPGLAHQIDSNKLRAYHLADLYRAGLTVHDWTVQSLSGGYGPLGFYAGVRELIGEGDWPSDQAPKLLGVQQQTVCPFVPQAADAKSPTPAMLEPTLYATSPKHAAELKQDVRDFGGHFLAIQNQSYLSREPELERLLANRGLDCGRAVYHPEKPIVERSGLIALVGAMEAVDQGIISAGSRVLVSLTGGCGPDLAEPANAEFTLRADQSIEEFWRHAARYQSSAEAKKPV